MRPSKIGGHRSFSGPRQRYFLFLFFYGNFLFRRTCIRFQQGGQRYFQAITPFDSQNILEIMGVSKWSNDPAALLKTPKKKTNSVVLDKVLFRPTCIKFRQSKRPSKIGVQLAQCHLNQCYVLRIQTTHIFTWQCFTFSCFNGTGCNP